MNTFSAQDIVIFMVIVFVLLLIVFFFAVKMSKRPKESEQVGKLDQDKKGALGKILKNLSTSYSPELELEAEELPHYQKRKYFFSIGERKFFEFLSTSIGNKYQIFAHVRMADVLFIANEPEKKKYFNNHIRCRHFDYILCESPKQKLIMAIELDDSSHQRFDRKASDDFKDMACQTAGLPLLRIKLPNKYSRDEFSALIQAQREKS